jgi:hypothetical protein
MDRESKMREMSLCIVRFSTVLDRVSAGFLAKVFARVLARVSAEPVTAISPGGAPCHSQRSNRDEPGGDALRFSEAARDDA